MDISKFDNISLEWKDGAIPKKNGELRYLKIPNDELKEAQADILQYLYELQKKKQIQISTFAHGFVPWRSTHSAMSKHSLESDVFIGMDVKDFFDNFPKEPVRKALIDAKIGYMDTDRLLQLCTFDDHFPQGSPTSPFLTNIGMFETDLMIAAYASRLGFVYTRYADDLTFSLRPDAKAMYSRFKKDGTLSHNPYLRFFYGVDTLLNVKLGLHLNHKKDHIIYRHSKCKSQILGIVMRDDNKGYNADRHLRENARAAAHNLANRLRETNGVYSDSDIGAWKALYGKVQYMDNVRSHSPDAEVSGADPRIKESDWEYLVSIFGAQELKDE